MMKLRSSLLLVTVLMLAACSSEEDASGLFGNSQEQGEEVEVTLPVPFIKGQDTDELVADMERYGEVEAIENEDGSLTLKMAGGAHEELMKETEKGIQATVDMMTTGEGYMSFEEIAHNDAYDEFTAKVDKEVYEITSEELTLIALGFSGTMYQVLNGEDFASADTLVIVIDEATGEEIHTYTYPEEEQ